ncbi:MAG: hypothetical protein JXB23_08075 [Candidatus Aminicenantes bacterium]|nr:hypothetical protein [Candidatus Aminicenantes bacterium]
MDEQYLSFLKKRRRLAIFWPVVATLLLMGILAFLVWMFVKNPLLVNPFEVASRIDAGTIENSTLILMAGMLPIMFLACILILVVVVLFGFSMFSKEKKYLDIIDRLLREETDNPEIK